MNSGYWMGVFLKLGIDNGKRDQVADCIAAVVRRSLEEYMTGVGPLADEMTHLLEAAANIDDPFFKSLGSETAALGVWTQLEQVRNAKEQAHAAK